jgi:hypothetical protein
MAMILRGCFELTSLNDVKAIKIAKTNKKSQARNRGFDNLDIHGYRVIAAYTSFGFIRSDESTDKVKLLDMLEHVDNESFQSMT